MAANVIERRIRARASEPALATCQSRQKSAFSGHDKDVCLSILRCRLKHRTIKAILAYQIADFDFGNEDAVLDLAGSPDPMEQAGSGHGGIATVLQNHYAHPSFRE
jgi:hypothetical protein